MLFKSYECLNLLRYRYVKVILIKFFKIKIYLYYNFVDNIQIKETFNQKTEEMIKWKNKLKISDENTLFNNLCVYSVLLKKQKSL